MAHKAALTFDLLRDYCAQRYPGITVRRPGDRPTTPAQNAANYDAIANCAYTEFGAKPYWLPALVASVDICGAEVGPSWRLLSEDDVLDFSDRDANVVAGSLATMGAKTSGGLGEFYFALRVRVDGPGGSLRVGNLASGIAKRLTDLTFLSDSKVHHEGALSLRCIRVTPVPAPSPLER